ncbi:MAG: ABC transporter ATP-binding protein [Chthoniobacteraceae bacterium]
MAAISVRQLGKQFRLGLKMHNTLRDQLAALLRRDRKSSSETFWALRELSFEIGPGEVVGIIGRNGAGKSTLLKVLSQITEPTEGEVRILGRVASLLEVGTGFHPELSGRENVFLNGAILGMSRIEIRAKFDEIVAFAEVEKFIDTPVKHYSSGMYVRLAFAVAAHLEPEILIVDEVLAVGDAAFQKRCMNKMSEVGRQGRTILFVSHNMGAVEALCSRAILLQNGRLEKDGSVAEVVDAYLGHASADEDLLQNQDSRPGNGKARFYSVHYQDHAGTKVQSVRCGDAVEIVVQYRVAVPLQSPVLRMTLYSSRGVAVANLDTEASAISVAASGDVRLSCRIDCLNVAVGHYSLNVGMADFSGLIDHAIQIAPLVVESSNYLGTGKLPSADAGMIVFRPSWNVEAR